MSQDFGDQTLNEESVHRDFLTEEYEDQGDEITICDKTKNGNDVKNLILFRKHIA